MSKDTDRQTKTAPPRESDSARQARLIEQLGLKKEGSAKMRRHKERTAKKAGERKRR